jgi:hypothetical protein
LTNIEGPELLNGADLLISPLKIFIIKSDKNAGIKLNFIVQANSA